MRVRGLLVAGLTLVLLVSPRAATGGPDDVVAQARQALLRLRTAEAALESAKRTDGEAKVKSCEDDVKSARVAFADVVESAPRDTWTAPGRKELLVQGLVAVGETERRDRAIEAYEDLLVKVPDCVEAHRARSKRLPELYAAEGDLAAVLPRLAKLAAAGSDADKAALLVKTGDVHAALGDFAAFRTDYAEAKRIAAGGFGTDDAARTQRLAYSMQSEGREYVGAPLADAEIAAWSGPAAKPLSGLRGRVAVLFAGGVGAPAGWSRLQELDRLRAASDGGPISVFAWTNLKCSTYERRPDKDGRKWAWSPVPPAVGRNVEVEVKPEGFAEYVGSVRAARRIECPVALLVETTKTRIVASVPRVFVVDGSGTVTYAGCDDFAWLAPLVRAVVDRTK